MDAGATPWLAWLDTGFDLSLRAGARRQVRVACFDGSGWSCPDGGSALAGVSRSLTDALAVGLTAGAAGDVVALWTHRETNNLSCLYLRRLQAGVWREVAGSASVLGIGFPAATRSQGPLWPRLALKSGNAEVVMAGANDNANSSNFTDLRHAMAVSWRWAAQGVGSRDPRRPLGRMAAAAVAGAPCGQQPARARPACRRPTWPPACWWRAPATCRSTAGPARR